MKIKPKKINKGDTIGIICPSYFISSDSERIKKMEEVLIGSGYKIKYGKSFYAKEAYLAGSDELRARDVEQMFLDQDVKAIICMLGGFGASRMVDLIDYNIIKNNPKLFMGFSDVTVLLNAINQRAQLSTYHGVVGIYIGNPKFEGASYDDFMMLLNENQKNRILKNPNNDASTLISGVANGELVGGNLTLISCLLGTEFEIDFKDKIVFIEEVDEEPYKIDRYFSSLRLSNKLKEAKGFVFGYFTNCTPNKEKDSTWNYLDIIRQYIEPLGKPTVYNFASGHDFPFVNLPIGLNVELDATNKIIKILDEYYEEEGYETY